MLDHVARTICESGGHRCLRGPFQEWEEIAVEMRHAALKQLCTLSGLFDGSDGGQCAIIPGTHCPNKMVRIYCTPGHPVGDVAVIELPRDSLSQAPRASILYIWIF